jgi:hypothetical protein
MQIFLLEIEQRCFNPLKARGYFMYHLALTHQNPAFWSETTSSKSGFTTQLKTSSD